LRAQLLKYFGSGDAIPSSPAPKSPTAAIPAAPSARTIEPTTGLTKLTSKKDRDDNLIFGGGKKKPAPPKQKTAAPTGGAKGKGKGFVLSMDVMKTLGELGVGLPTNEDGVKSTVEELKTKLSYYKDNQVRVTQEVPPRTPLCLAGKSDFFFLEY
jgi:hypothetical protein